MKYLVTGHEGKVGSRLVEKGAIPLELQLTDFESMKNALLPYKEDEYVLIHTAAMTSVDDCEKFPKRATEVNSVGTVNLSDLIPYQSRMVFLSTCHVFDGSFVNFLPHEHHRPYPINAYGLSKAGAEIGLSQTISKGKMNIVRASKMFTKEDVMNIVEKGRKGDAIDAVGFIRRSMSYLPDFVDVLWRYVTDGKFPVGRASFPRKNIIHIAGGLRVSYLEFYRTIFDVFKLDDTCLKSRQFERSGYAPRPKYGGLSVKVAERNGYVVRPYRDALIEIRDEE